MRRTRDTVIHRLGRRRSLGYWAAAVGRSDRVGLRQLAAEAGLARRLRTELDRLLAVADHRLAARDAAAMADGPALLPGDDWRWSPDAFRIPLDPPGLVPAENGARFGAGLALFHDSRSGEVTLRQRRAPAPEVVLEVYRFAGSFLSFAVSLPPEGRDGLGRGHVLTLEAAILAERPLEMFARLNLRCGPNTETQVIDLVPDAAGRVSAGFDLAHMDVNAARLEQVWIDLILEAPEMNAVTLRGVTVARRPRAAL